LEISNIPINNKICEAAKILIMLLASSKVFIGLFVSAFALWRIAVIIVFLKIC
jgi:hypothetical protein